MRVSRSAIAASLLLLGAPLTALAHEHHTYQIGDKSYSIGIGSINEPVAVDDKSGVEIEVMDLDVAPHHEDMVMADGDEHVGSPVVGLESSLKVEVSAGDQKKVFDLRPVWGEPGGYKAVFIPTVQTTYTYRLTGTINNVPVDLSFVCSAAGEEAVEDTTAHELSEGVTRTHKSGAFGCPGAKEDIAFPLAAAPAADLTARVGALEGGSNTSPLTIAALVFGILGFTFGAGAIRKVSAQKSVQ